MTPRFSWVASILAAGMFCCVSPGTAQAQCPDPSARVLHIDRRVEYKAASADVFVPASLNLDVCRGDSVRTGERSRATIVFVDSTRLVIDQNTEWVVREPTEPGRTLIELIRGAILFFTRQPRSLDVQTPFVNARVEGTEFLVRVEADRTVITVFEGRVAAANPSGSLTLTGNESAVAVQGQAPQRQVIVRPRDAVQWALHYQPILAETDSFDQLDQIPEAQRDARFYVRRAGLLLGVGRLDEARADIGQALTRNPDDGDAYALQAVIAVALNDRTEALVNGREAVRRSPGSAASRIALSYALQANFELEAARDQLAQAVADQPNDARAWARLAELWLSLGYLDRAREAAERAASLAPDEARASTVLGFAALARVDTSGARTAFERAIALESDSPLARLGLGLAKIREGDLADGRRDIEIAAALNPDDPTVRSYLGKAYFDEKRDALAGESFDMAKSLDPFDPTPWFYDAVRKQTQNRPIEALADLQRSIALNGSRAVYRSRFLLDGDQAARGARLGRIYRDLGFEQLALVEASKSLAVNASDHSAHRFLADSYLTLPRHEIAGDSELLQAQLLQPLNINPVQPRLADNGLVFLDDTGPSSVAFNEFSRLFAANQIRFTADGIGGSQATRADNLILSGIVNRLSYSVGQFHFQTAGFRDNNDLRQNLAHAFIQAEVAPGTSAQVEVRREDSEEGDRRVLFDPGIIRDRQREVGDMDSVRVGIRRDLTPRAVVIASYIHRSGRNALTTGPGTELATRENADFSEARYIQAWRRLSLNAGGGYYRGNFLDQFTLRSRRQPDTASETTHANVYIYSGTALTNDLTVVAGVSLDDFEGAGLTRRQANPKIGVTWSLGPRTTLRAAAFTALRRTLISSQTIEPTQLAGFNQFYREPDATKSRRAGLGLDHAFGPRLHGGAEWSAREVDVPVLNIRTGRVTDDPAGERFGRAYVYFTPGSYVAIATEYQFERIARDPEGNNESLFARSRTHRFSVGARAFHPSGMFGELRAVVVDQAGRFADQDFIVADRADRFLVADCSVGYRLPRHLGTVAVVARNVLNQQFRFQDSAPVTPRLIPQRLVTVRLTLSL